jgi:hypothetical protein
MLKQLKELLSSESTRKSLQACKNDAEAAATLTKAGIAKGYAWTEATVKKALSELRGEVSELSDAELMGVAGGLMANSANKLCHTESCGGSHPGCCPP